MIHIRTIAILFSSLVTVTAVAAAFMLFTPQGAGLIVRPVASRFLGSGDLAYERLEGSLIRGVHVVNMEIRRPPVLREDSVVRVQEFGMRLTRFSIDGIELSLINARVISPRFDPVVVNGSFIGGRYNMNLYGNNLDLAALGRIMKKLGYPVTLTGALRAPDLFLRGTFAQLVLEGSFVVDHIYESGFSLRDAPVDVYLSFACKGNVCRPYGKLEIHTGVIQGPQTSIRLGESRLAFSGDIDNPDMNIHGVSVVGRTWIDIMVRGTRKEPKVHLVSDPQLPQEQLMLMMATGKRWDSLNTSMGSGKMTPELAGDFVDYYFFGGAGSRLAKFFGLTGVSYKLDEKTQGVTLNKDLTDRLGVGYGVSISTTGPEGQKELTQTVDSEYRLSNKVSVSVQKEVLSQQKSAAISEPRRIPDDRVYLKYRTKF
jgi:hypothetical protein